MPFFVVQKALALKLDKFRKPYANLDQLTAKEKIMTNQIWANMPVKDVERARRFFKTIGFRINEEHDNGDKLASFMVGEGNFIIHFFPENAFKTVAEHEVADAKKGNEILFSLSAGSREEVDIWTDMVKKAGGAIFSEPKETTGGIYGFVFEDLDGHRWNVLFRDR